MSLPSSINLPQEVEFILNILNEASFEAFIVGGCVRDRILGNTPKDWDITTNAKPEEVRKLFEKTIDTGIKHGTVTVLINNQNFEVTTYRIDGKYTDNRRPESVEFTSSLECDLSRRDFTINAIAYHPIKGFVDPFGGITDINNCTIKTVGNAAERFNEDALRMLRAIRFSAQLNFNIEANTLEAIIASTLLIHNISPERIRDELTKILVSVHPEKLQLLRDTGLLRLILPEFDACFETTQNHPYHKYNVAMHSIKAVSSIDAETALRWTMLLHDIGKHVTKTTDKNNIDHFYGHPHESMIAAKSILERLRFDNKTINKISRLIKHHDRAIAATDKSIRKAIQAVGDDVFLDLLKVEEADAKAQNLELSAEKLNKLDKIEQIYLEIKEKRQCLELKHLAVNGDDLINLGFKPGLEIGTILNKLLDLVIENPALNNKETLIQLVKSE